jgi:hypothetical protein
VTDWLAAERSGANIVGPGSDWDPLWAREMDDALRLGDLAARMARVAARLTEAVATVDMDAIRRVVRGLTQEPLSEDVEMLLVVQAAMIAGVAGRRGAGRVTAPSPADLLAWVRWDEHGQPLPAPAPEAAAAPQPVPAVAHVAPAGAGQHHPGPENELRQRREGHRNAA